LATASIVILTTTIACGANDDSIKGIALPYQQLLPLE
jgi:hypothetical protein